MEKDENNLEIKTDIKYDVIFLIKISKRFYAIYAPFVWLMNLTCIEVTWSQSDCKNDLYDRLQI